MEIENPYEHDFHNQCNDISCTTCAREHSWQEGFEAGKAIRPEVTVEQIAHSLSESLCMPDFSVEKAAIAIHNRIGGK